MTVSGTEKTSRLSEERCRALITALEIVWTTDASGQVIEDQPGWRAFTGQTREEIKGAGWLAAVHPDSRQKAAAGWASAVARGSPYETEWCLRRRDDEYRFFSIRAAPVREKNGTIREWIGCNIDITDHKQRDEDLVRLHARADTMVTQLERERREMQILKNLGDTLQACNSREEAYPFISLAATELFPGARGALAVPVPGAHELLATAIDWGGDPLDKGGVVGQPTTEGAWMKADFTLDDCWALRRGAMHEPGVGTVCQHFMPGPGGPHACIPLAVRGEVSGLLSVRFPGTQGLDDQRRAALSAFGNAVALGLSTLQLRESFQNQHSAT